MFGNRLGTQKIQFSEGVGKGMTTDNLKDQAFPFHGDHLITSHKLFSDDVWILLREY